MLKPNLPEVCERLRRNAYLHSRGVKTTQPYQLNLIFPDTIGSRDDLWHIPNDCARSAIFTVRNKREPRRSLVREKLFHYNDYISIFFTGIELRAEDDEIIWLQILKYCVSVALGEPVDFCISKLVADVGWHKNGRYYDKTRECISRLKANEVLALNAKAYGTSGAFSLIQKYIALNDENGKPTHYRVWLDPSLIVMFAGNTFTSHRWMAYRALSPVARRLADYIESHGQPFPLALDRFRQICGSGDKNASSWRQTVNKACVEVQAAQIAKRVFVSDHDNIYIVTN